MKVDKQRLLGILHRSWMPFQIIFSHFRTFVLVGYEDTEETLEHVDLPAAPHLTGKTVMVTGAGGLIGSEISRQLIQYQPARILLLGHGPQSIYSVEYQLRKLNERHTEIIPIIANVHDRKRLFEIIGRHKPDIIYHTAGRQQIEFTEEKPVEEMYANVFGINNVAEAANRHRVSALVLVSSEQAAKPRNLMQAAERLAEMIVESVSMTSLTQYTIIRLPDMADQSRKSYRSFEQRASAGDAAQSVLQAGRAITATGRRNFFRPKNANSQTGIGQQAALSQIELARLLKQLKTASDDKAQDLVISLIRQ